MSRSARGHLARQAEIVSVPSPVDPPVSQLAAPVLGDDLIWSAQGVADELKIDVRRAFYLLENKHIPCRKVGGLWVVSRSGLRAALIG
jgi:hypothetical protein